MQWICSVHFGGCKNSAINLIEILFWESLKKVVLFFQLFLSNVPTLLDVPLSALWPAVALKRWTACPHPSTVRHRW